MLKWTKCSDLPVGMFQAQSIVINGKVYVGGGITGDNATDCLVFEYNRVKDTWDVLPPAPVSLFGLGQLLGELVIVGGKQGNKATNNSYVYDENARRWKHSIPPMCNARYAPAVVSHHSSMMACGGLTEDNEGEVECVTTVEVINTDTYQWYIASYLPRSACLSISSCVTIHDSCYLIGGYRYTTANSASKVAHYTSLTSLLSNVGLTPYGWKPLTSTPHMQTTAACLGGCLLAIGGTSSPYTMPVQKSIHAYSSSTKTWIYIGDLPYGCCHCSAVSLPGGELLVVGGWVQPGESKRSVSVYRGNITL